MFAGQSFEKEDPRSAATSDESLHHLTLNHFFESIARDRKLSRSSTGRARWPLARLGAGFGVVDGGLGLVAFFFGSAAAEVDRDELVRVVEQTGLFAV